MSSVISPYTIRLLAMEDAAALAQLESLCFPLAWTCEQYQKLFTANAVWQDREDCLLPPMTVLGVENRDCERNLVAYLSLGIYHDAGELEIYNIAVSPVWRCSGIATKLLAMALSLAVRCKIQTAFLEVRPSNVAALTLYEKFGFTQCGRRKGYYTDTGEDALVMRCELGAVSQ